jgi:hypothetical protein
MNTSENTTKNEMLEIMERIEKKITLCLKKFDDFSKKVWVLKDSTAIEKSGTDTKKKKKNNTMATFRSYLKKNDKTALKEFPSLPQQGHFVYSKNNRDKLNKIMKEKISMIEKKYEGSNCGEAENGDISWNKRSLDSNGKTIRGSNGGVVFERKKKTGDIKRYDFRGEGAWVLSKNKELKNKQDKKYKEGRKNYHKKFKDFMTKYPAHKKEFERLGIKNPCEKGKTKQKNTKKSIPEDHVEKRKDEKFIETITETEDYEF